MILKVVLLFQSFLVITVYKKSMIETQSNLKNFEQIAIWILQRSAMTTKPMKTTSQIRETKAQNARLVRNKKWKFNHILIISKYIHPTTKIRIKIKEIRIFLRKKSWPFSFPLNLWEEEVVTDLPTPWESWVSTTHPPLPSNPLILNARSPDQGLIEPSVRFFPLH